MKVKMFLSSGEEVHFTPPGESTYTPTTQGVVVEFNGSGCAVQSYSSIVTWPEVEIRARNEDFGGGYRAALKHRP